MDKSRAIDLLGGSPAAAARSLGISPQSVYDWPEVLPPRIAQRVVGALALQRLDPKVLAEIGIGEAPSGLESATAGGDAAALLPPVHPGRDAA